MVRCVSLAPLVRRDRLTMVLTLLVVAMLIMISVQVLSVGVADGSDDVPASAYQLRECYRDLARAYYDQHPRESTPEAEKFRRRSWRLLAAVVRALDGLQVPHWIGCGTLLGFARQCELVPAMNDVDVEVAAEAVWSRGLTVQQLVDAAAAEGALLRHRFGMPADSLELAFEDGNGTKLDLFFSYPAEDGSRYISGIDTGTLQKYRWPYPAFELCWGLLDGLRVGMPCDPTPYISTMYGPDWASPPPKGEWNYRVGSPNVIDSGRFPESSRSEVFQSFEV